MAARSSCYLIAIVALGGGCKSDDGNRAPIGTWSAPVNLSNSTDISEIRLNWGHSLAVSATGTVHAVWREVTDAGPDPDHAKVIHRRRTAAGWEPAQDLAAAGPGIGHPKIATEGASVYVVWHVYDPNPTRDDRVDLRRSIDDGASFEAPRTIVDDAVVTALNPLAEMSTTPSIAAAADRVHLAWSDERPIAACGGSVPEIYLSSSIDRGAQWSAPRQVSSVDCRTSWTPAVAAAGAYVHLAWTDDRDKVDDCGTAPGVPCLEEIYYRRLSDFGATADASEVRITADPANNPQPSWGPSLATDGDDVHLAFMDRSGGDEWEVYVAHSADAGATWALPAPVVSAHAPDCLAARPTLAAAAGTVHVVWFEACLTANASWIAHRRSENAGQTWSEIVDVTAGTSTFAIQPSVAAAPAGVHVLWTDVGEMYYAGNPR